MQETRPRYLGIDLGTTNSAAAVFDGDELQIVRAADGGTLTPSVVRIDKQGRLSVGSKARRARDRDPDNTHTEFKRLMGTARSMAFPAAGVSHPPRNWRRKSCGPSGMTCRRNWVFCLSAQSSAYPRCSSCRNPRRPQRQPVSQDLNALSSSKSRWRALWPQDGLRNRMEEARGSSMTSAVEPSMFAPGDARWAVARGGPRR